MILKDLLQMLEREVPFSLQEDYDNSGLQLGDPGRETQRALISLDVTPGVVDEAIARDCDLIISHHPLLFGGLKRITPGEPTGQMVYKAIRQGIAIISMHTNLDNVHGGVNSALADRLGLHHQRILQPMEGRLSKLVTFCPLEQAGDVRQALFDAGCGRIGNYDSCSFNTEGQGTFRALGDADPFVGQKGELHFESEQRIEAVFHSRQEKQVIHALLQAHPYEEVAYDIINLGNKDSWHGAGMIGELPEALEVPLFLELLKDALGLANFRYAGEREQPVSRVAVCGGSGSFLIERARREGAHAFVTGDIKYHQFFEAGPEMLLCDVGHYESERFVVEYLKALILKKFPTFAVLISETGTNPVRHYN